MSSPDGKKVLDKQATGKKVLGEDSLDAGKKVLDKEAAGKKVLDEKSLDAGKKVSDAEVVSDEELSDEEGDEDSRPVVIIDLRDYQKENANGKEARPTATMFSEPENITTGLDELHRRPFIMLLPAPSVAATLREMLLTDDEDAAEEDAPEEEPAEDKDAVEEAKEDGRCTKEDGRCKGGRCTKEKAAKDAAEEDGPCTKRGRCTK